MIWSNGELRLLPMKMSSALIKPLLQSSLISWPGKLRMGMDLFIPLSNGELDDESMAAFVRRRLGKEALHKIADPLMAGIYAGDPERLSLKSTFPRFQELEKKHGGLLRALWAQKIPTQVKAANQKSFSPLITLRDGLQKMIDVLVAKLDPGVVSLNRCILAVRCTLDDYEIFIKGEPSIHADAIIFATPAYVTADLVRGIAPKLAEKLLEIRYVSTATVSLGFRRGDLHGSFNSSGNSSGYLVPHSEQRNILGCTWCSSKFDGRAPDDGVLIKTFIGGARAEHLAEQENACLVDLARQELLATMGIQATPVLEKVYRWQKANPQYEVGHQARMTEIDRLLSQFHGLYLAGAGYRGVGIPDCIQSGNQAAQALLQDMIDPETPEPSCGDHPSRKCYEYH
jgi:oxygen-dependent protoporphyrinogen oxidase